MYPFLLVFIGGGMGSVCRYALSLALAPLQPRFPWATLLANALACLVLGWVLSAALQGRLSDSYRLLLAAGFCGGFSTFSTFTAESVQLYQHGNMGFAVLNTLANIGVCVLFFMTGARWASG